MTRDPSRGDAEGREQHGVPSARPRWMLVAITLAIPWMLLALLELGLRVGGFGDDYPLFVPYRDDPRYVMPNEAVGRRYFRGAFVPSVHLDFFRAEKSPRTLRLIFQGESSAAGFPYGHGGAPSRMIEQRLQATFPGRDVEVVNTALTAVSSYVLLDQAAEIVRQHPDAVLIYTGHNEYYGVLGAASTTALGGSRAMVLAYLALRRLRLVQLLDRAIASARRSEVPNGAAPGTVMELMAGNQLVPLGSALYDKGIAQFRANLDALLSRYERAHIPVYIGTLVSDERDQPPLANGRAPNDSLDADAYYRLARARDAQGDTAAARALYRAAKERDALRFRAPEAMNAVIREVARRHGAFVVETQRAMERASPGGVPGHSLILEHLHPNLDGYFAIADAFYAELRASRAFGTWPAVPAPNVSVDSARAHVPVTALDSLAGLYRTDRLTAGWPFRPRSATVPAIVDTLHPRTALESLAQQLVNGRTSWAEATDRLRVSFDSAGDADGSLRAARALAAEFRYAEQPYVDAARTELARGRVSAALDDAMRALARRETPETATLAATLMLRAGNPADAVPLLQRATALSPADGALRGALAAARILPRLEAARAQAPNDTVTLLRLAQAYVLTQQVERARETLRALLSIAPASEAGRALERSLPSR